MLVRFLASGWRRRVMTKSARRKDSEQRSLELDLKIDIMILKEQLMELEEDYDDLWNFSYRMFSYMNPESWASVEAFGKELQGFKSDRIT